MKSTPSQTVCVSVPKSTIVMMHILLVSNFLFLLSLIFHFSVFGFAFGTKSDVSENMIPAEDEIMESI